MQMSVAFTVSCIFNHRTSNMETTNAAKPATTTQVLVAEWGRVGFALEADALGRAGTEASDLL